MRPIQRYSMIDRRNRREARRGQSLRRRLARFGLGCSAAALVALFVLLLAGSLAYTSLVADLPSLQVMTDLLRPDDGLLAQPTRLYDRSGQHVLLSLENPGIERRFLPLDEKEKEHLSPDLVRVTLGVLDPQFWNSPGYSVRFLFDPQPQTIAERLADDLLLWREPAGLRRALRMRILASQLVSVYGHEQVLAWYLNSAAFGHLTFGADSAARLYLDKPASALTLSESALLVAAIQAPALNPIDAPQPARERHQRLLAQLLVQGVLSPDEYATTLSQELTIVEPNGSAPSPAAAFSRLAMESLAKRFGRDRLERGGLRVITTLDYSLQTELNCLVRTQLSRLAGSSEAVNPLVGETCRAAQLLPTLPPGLEPLPADVMANAVLLDPRSGEVLALLGDTTSESETAWMPARPPGSLLTPFVALTGFARGMSPANLVWDIPSSLPESLAARQNPDLSFHGPVRLRKAVANDYLASQVQLLEQMGATNVWQSSAALGLASLAGESESGLIYAGGHVSPLEVAQAYGVLAAQGVRSGQRSAPGGDLEPVMVTYVEDLQGTVWFQAQQPETQMVVSSQLAYLVHHVISDTTARWPSLGYSNPLEIGRPAGAKLGQVQDGDQMWVAGYIPQRVAVFWLGFPQGMDVDGQVNAKMASGMWHALMQHLGRDLPPEDWPMPSGLTQLEVCDPSGQLPTAACPEVVREIFLTGTEPTAPDALFRVFQINRETGKLATVFTPPLLVEEKTFLVVPPEASDWARTAKLPVPPEDYDAIQLSGQSDTVRIDQPEAFAFVSGQVELQGTASGDGFRFYQLQVGQGLNPQSWQQVGEDGVSPVEGDVLGTWDTTALEGDNREGLYAVRLLVVRDDQRVETTTIQVTVDNTAPIVRIPYPLAGQKFAYPAERAIIFQAEVEEMMGVSRVVWLVDGKEVGKSLQAPFITTWQPKRGQHTLEVRAYDLAGNEGKSEQVVFSVGK